MITEIILSVLLLVTAGICAVIFRKYSALRGSFEHNVMEVVRLQTELENSKSVHTAELQRMEEEWSRALRQSKETAEDMRAREASVAEARLTDLRQLYETQLAELKETHRTQLEHERESLGERFKAMAADVLRVNSQELDKNSRISIEAMLAPVRASLDEFAKGYRECYDVENRDRLSLREELKVLMEQSKVVGEEAKRLTAALKGNTGVQGKWGEMVLANILEHSGLQRSRWFVTQETVVTGDECLRPDAVIHCPGNRDIIIDSKVSLTSYLQLLEADTDDAKKRLAEAHLKSVQNHIRTLYSKEYQKKVGAKKGDFVLMFMPHEGAYIAAMHANPQLWMNAYDSHVVMVSPTHLVTVIHLVEQMWRTEDQSVNSENIAKCGEDLLNSVTAFLADMEAVGKGLAIMHKNYDSAVKRLTTGRNNVTSIAGRLRDLGIRGKKELPATFADSVDAASYTLPNDE